MFQDEFDKKDREIQNLSEQLQSKDEENTKLRQEIERLKKQMKEQMGKIAMM